MGLHKAQLVEDALYRGGCDRHERQQSTAGQSRGRFRFWKSAAAAPCRPNLNRIRTRLVMHRNWFDSGEIALVLQARKPVKLHHRLERAEQVYDHEFNLTRSVTVL
jgi:hypothetical protein